MLDILTEHNHLSLLANITIVLFFFNLNFHIQIFLVKIYKSFWTISGVELSLCNQDLILKLSTFIFTQCLWTSLIRIYMRVTYKRWSLHKIVMHSWDVDQSSVSWSISTCVRTNIKSRATFDTNIKIYEYYIINYFKLPQKVLSTSWRASEETEY